MTVSSGPSIWIQTGLGDLAERRVVGGRLAGDLVDVGDLGAVVGDELGEPLLAGPLGRQDAALAPLPGGLLLDDLVRLPELGQVLGQDVVELPVGRPDRAEVGVAVEHAEQAGRGRAPCGGRGTGPALA